MARESFARTAVLPVSILVGIILLGILVVGGFPVEEPQDIPVGQFSVHGRETEPGGSNADLVRTDAEGRFRLRLAEGGLIDIHAGVPMALADVPEGMLLPPEPATEVVVQGVPAGRRDVVIRLRQGPRLTLRR